MTDRPRLRPDILQRDVEEELLLYDPLNGETLLCNATAAAVVDLCDGSRDPANIADAIVSVMPTASREASVPAAYPVRSIACAKMVKASWPVGSTITS